MTSPDRRESPSRSRSRSQSPGSSSPGRRSRKDDDEEVLPRTQRNALRTYITNKDKIKDLENDELMIKDRELKVRKKEDTEIMLEALKTRNSKAILLTDLKSASGKNMYLRLETRKTLSPSLIPDKVADGVKAVKPSDVTSLYASRVTKIQKTQITKDKAAKKRRSNVIRPKTVGSNREPSPIRRIHDDFFDDTKDSSTVEEPSRRSPSPAKKMSRASDAESSSSNKRKRAAPEKKELGDDDLTVVYCLADVLTDKIYEASSVVKSRPVINDICPRKGWDKDAPLELINIVKRYMADNATRNSYKTKISQMRRSFKEEADKAKESLMTYMKTEDRKTVLIPIEIETEGDDRKGTGSVTLTYRCEEVAGKLRNKGALNEVVREAVKAIFENNSVFKNRVMAGDETGTEYIKKLLDRDNPKAQNFRTQLTNAVQKKIDEWERSHSTVKERVNIDKKEDPMEDEEDDAERQDYPLPSHLAKAKAQMDDRRSSSTSTSSSSDSSRKSPGPSGPPKKTTFAPTNNANSIAERSGDLKARLLAKKAAASTSNKQ